MIHHARKDAAHPYTKVSRAFYRDKRLSPAAKGVMGCVLDLHPKRRVTVAQLEDMFPPPTRGQSMPGILRELAHFGYAKRVHYKDRAGRFCGSTYDFYETPQPRQAELALSGPSAQAQLKGSRNKSQKKERTPAHAPEDTPQSQEPRQEAPAPAPPPSEKRPPMDNRPSAPKPEVPPKDILAVATLQREAFEAECQKLHQLPVTLYAPLCRVAEAVYLWQGGHKAFMVPPVVEGLMLDLYPLLFTQGGANDATDH